jgi:hypothetical protein
MEALEEHRRRVAALRDTLTSQIARHRRLYDLRSDSWREQNSGDPDRAHVLDEMHREIDALEQEIERMDGIWERPEEIHGT